jgi:hypothetical protein
MKLPWWAYLAAGLLVFLGGFFTGRDLHWGNKPGNDSTGIAVPSTLDAGLPAAVAAASTGPSSCDAGVQVRIIQVPSGPPVVIRLPADAGSYTCPACPSCPEIDVSAGAVATAGPSTAHADAPVTVIHTVDHVRDFRAFGLGPAVSVDYHGAVGYGAELTWQPADWVEVNVTPTTKQVTTAVQFRFDLK